MKSNRIVDDQLCISGLEPAMAADLFRLVDGNRTYLKRWLPWLDANRSEEDSLNFINNSLLAFEKKEQIVWAVNFRDKVVGIISFNVINWSTRTAQIGYWLAEAETGKGLISKCVTSIEGLAFDEMELEKIEIRCAVENWSSRRIPENLGYSLEGVIRRAENLYGRIVDHAVYGKLKIERDRNPVQF